MRRAIVFDLDGTIIDTETPEFVTWQEVYAERGVTLERAVWTRVIGTSDADWDPYSHLESLLGTQVDREAIGAARNARFDELMAAAEPRPGVVAWLDEAHDLGLRLGVASSSGVRWVTRFLDASGLRDRFQVLVTRERVTRSKPAPELYQLALHDLGVRPDEAIAVEDSPNGVLAAKAAGLFCVAVPNPMTADLPMPDADLVLSSLTERPLRSIGDVGPAAAEIIAQP